MFFYTSRDAKTSVPGLWPGTVYGMAESGLSPNEAHNALDRLVARGLAQYDSTNQLVRLTELPDYLDRAHTEQAIWGWWGRFKTLPNVPLRNAHVPLLWEMVSSGKTNQKMVDTWRQTFGTVVIPTHLPTYLPLSSSDTSTVVQPSLFSAHSNEISKSGPSPLPRDLRSGSEIGIIGAEPEDPERSRTGGVLLHLVPAEPEPPPPDYAAEARNAHADEMKRALREAAEKSGASFLLPKEG